MQEFIHQAEGDALGFHDLWDVLDHHLTKHLNRRVLRQVLSEDFIYAWPLLRVFKAIQFGEGYAPIL